MEKDLIEKFRDPLWRLSNLYKIKTKSGSIENLVPNEAQTQYLKDEKQNNIILKARQLGFSTLCLIRLLDKALFTPNTTCVIMAHKRDSVQKLFKIIKFAYDNYPTKYPKAKAKYDTKNELDFDEINSRIYVATEVRGDTIDALHISEMAFMDEAEDKFIATVSAVTPTGSTTIESTANGIGDFFYDFYNTALERGFTPHFFPWMMASEYRMPAIGVEFDDNDLKIKEKYALDDNQLSWYMHKRRQLGAKFQQEFPATAMEAFLSSGDNVFDSNLLDELNPKEPLVHHDNTFVWKHPEMGHRYCMGVDVSEGINRDESAIDIIDIETGEQVWHFSGRIAVPALAEKVEIYAKKYNNCYLIPEANNHGFSLIYLLQDKGLHIYKRERFDGPKVRRVDRLGWQTTRRTKPLMVHALKTALYEKDVKINHKKTIAQMKTFVNSPENGKMGAAHGKLDDCVISLCLAWQGVRIQPETKRKAYDTFDFGDSSTSMTEY
jgi:hypothetical protein